MLQDPNADDDAPLILDRVRFEDVWTGEVILVKRDYEIDDEEQPFGLGLVAALLFRERWMVRDVTICAVMLGFLALAPIMFWRLMSDRVLYFKAYNTFYVLCVAMLILIVFEAAFTYLRQFLILHMTTRVDAKLGTYVFEKVLNLPIDFFERTQSGKIFHDMWELRKIRTFLVGQLFGTILDSTTLLILHSGHVLLQPGDDGSGAGMLRVSSSCGFWRCCRIIGEKSSAAEAAATEHGSFLVQTIHGIRTVKSLALDARQRHMCGRACRAGGEDCSSAEGMTGQSHVRRGHGRSSGWRSAAHSRSASISRLSTNDPVYIGALFAFMHAVAARRGTADADGAAGQPIGRSADRRRGRQQSGQSAGGGGTLRTTACLTPLRGQVEFSGVTFKYTGAVGAGAGECDLRNTGRRHARHHGPQRFGQNDDHPAVAAAAFQLRGPDQDRRRRCARIRRRSPARAASVSCCRRISCSAARSAKISRRQNPMRPLTRSFARPGWPAPRNSSTSCRAAMKPISTKARPICRAASGSGWPLRAP